MKNIYPYLVAFFFLFVSCTEFLEEEVFTEYDPEVFLQTEAGVDAVIVATYFESRPDYREAWFTFSEFPCDLMLERGGGYAAPAATFANFNWNVSNNFFRNAWRGSYEAIRNANSLLDEIDNVSALSADKVAVIKGEATFLRAYNYAFLHDFFGPTPLIKSAELDLEPTRASQEDFSTFVEQELRSAAAALPLSQEVYGKATKGAALTMLGRYYLNTKQWQKSADIYKEIIDLGVYSLFDNVEGLFAVENEANSELIFVFGSFSTATNANQRWNYTPHAYPVGYNTGQVNYGAQFQLWRWFVNSFDVNDRRASEYDPPNGKFGWIIKKYINKDGETIDLMNDPIVAGVEKLFPRPVKFTPDLNAIGADHGNDMPILRYAEVIVGRAEALNELQGPNQESIDLLNMIRNRAEAPEYALADFASKEALRDQILVERGLEFHAEGHRRRDLIRHGTFVSGAIARGVTGAQPHHVLYPIPQEELDSNPQLEQNPGY